MVSVWVTNITRSATNPGVRCRGASAVTMGLLAQCEPEGLSTTKVKIVGARGQRPGYDLT